MQIIDLKDKYKDKTIMVLGAGYSLENYSPEQYGQYPVIGINSACRYCKCDYIFYIDEATYNNDIINNPLATDSVLITLKNRPQRPPSVVLDSFNDISWERRPFHNSGLGALYLAYYMGANPILTCGIDLNSYNGEHHWKGYKRKSWQILAEIDTYKNPIVASLMLIIKKGDRKFYSLSPNSFLVKSNIMPFFSIN